jgi:site-specific DNA-methyltransferase (adenine-specific)
MTPYYQDAKNGVTLYHGDCLAVMKTLPDCSVDAIVTDPPAGIGFMGKSWDEHKGGRDRWINWLCERAEEMLRVLKPGGHALVWALPRTSHWTATALEDAGFEIRDRVAHLFGSGFPKSLDIGKAIDRAAGAEREVVGKYQYPDGTSRRVTECPQTWLASGQCGSLPVTAPATEAARQWDGWGTALKPAMEDWWLCRKPLSESTVAANVLKHGTGGLNIAATRVEVPEGDGWDVPQADMTKVNPARSGAANQTPTNIRHVEMRSTPDPAGRWPAHVTHDGSEEVLAVFPETGPSTGGQASKPTGYGEFGGGSRVTEKRDPGFGATGSAARFFQCCPPDERRVIYCPKASRADRDEGCEGMEAKVSPRHNIDGRDETNPKNYIGGTIPAPVRNHHPTVKNTALMRWLCRLITPSDGIILDCFAGSGSTGVAAFRENFRFIGIEAEAEYCEIAANRLKAERGRYPLFDY